MPDYEQVRVSRALLEDLEANGMSLPAQPTLPPELVQLQRCVCLLEEQK